MGRCYACDDMKESTRLAAIRLGYLVKRAPNKYQRWGMLYQKREQEKKEVLEKYKQQKKNLILM